MLVKSHNEMIASNYQNCMLLSSHQSRRKGSFSLSTMEVSPGLHFDWNKASHISTPEPTPTAKRIPFDFRTISNPPKVRGKGVSIPQTSWEWMLRRPLVISTTTHEGVNTKNSFWRWRNQVQRSYVASKVTPSKWQTWDLNPGLSNMIQGSFCYIRLSLEDLKNWSLSSSYFGNSGKRTHCQEQIHTLVASVYVSLF